MGCGKAQQEQRDVEDNEQQVSQEVYHVYSPQEVANMFDTSVESGLSDSEAANRLLRDGPNKLSEPPKRTIWMRIWDQVNNVLVFILVIVAVVSAIKAATSKDSSSMITGWIEVGLICGVIVLNTIIGIRQEGAAEKSADALKAMLSSSARVIRDGKMTEIPAEELVCGDVISISTGDRVPADVRFIKVANLSCQEAALTGESVPVEKSIDTIQADLPASVPLGDRKNLGFSATLVSQGEGVGIVVAIGDNTEIGTINHLVSQVEKKKTNVLIQIDTVSKFIAVFVVLIAIVTFIVAYFQAGNDALDSVSIALITSVAMIPEGLAAIVTLTYAYAVSNMASHNAIVRILPAVETLGSVTVICSDKTGTLTKNEMTLVALVTSDGRYKFDTDATERIPGNFVREDNFMAHERDSILKGGDIKLEEQANNNPQNSSDGKSFEALQIIDPAETQGLSPSHEFLRGALAGGVLCSHAKLGVDGGREGEIGNPTELAIVRAAYFANIDLEDMKAKQPLINQVPFSSEYKFMATVHEINPTIDGTDRDGLVVHVKGAPDRLITMASHQAVGGNIGSKDVEKIDRDYWFAQAANLSSHGLRVLALCRAEINKDAVSPQDKLGPEFVKREEPFLTIVGLCAIMDPPRPECVDAISMARGAGVRVAMITGDHKDTALAIGDMLGIVDAEHPNAITGPEMDSLDDDELRHVVMNNNVFARASPENKIRIVKALQAEGQVCSMTGDGVNDAPALKAADMGVAMGKEGTDVAREAAEMILADDNFATIVTAVREGRVVWDNLRKVLLFNTPVNNAQGLTVLFGMICGLKNSPLTAIQILYCNLICAVTLGFVLAVEPAEDGIMKNPPRRVGKRIIGRYLLLRIAIGTIILVFVTVGSVFIVLGWGYSLGRQRSQASNTLTFGAISICISARFAYNSSLHPRIFRGNRYAWYAIFLTAALQVCLTYIPGLNDVVFSMEAMTGPQWGLVFAGMAIVLLVMELEKAILRRVKAQGYDTDDNRKENQLFTGHEEGPSRPLVQSDSLRSASMNSTLLHH
uniref:Cation-transporting P-type ATPase N-terminal domain-containing protein n=1 Tax=Mucochytrium quahogii TaxID=96639 RepID=A0A7S2WDD6_9STRA|mmetsp:Transcript_4765/g.7171  ORF Transcript_4765/g.7171 Transcript_4765/m.7171 type:complete len:1042 (-) Transcript_4765:46-3171(-)|eukprot:CAMPEP_0203747738 /NCGR_PEP_ID=MMETSP0098-20131031/2804_1 /ASSEMBLY_ACC=CAM_ASM_000208 /TAXON_ID=96639 /ORGANISM=" , Strain NY0313808BC1" /LENGTH=1041 /DNA_ID=CAMNT_0050636259 /DNA_START=373 /DNA_END=3498 /DNA_ORIENTATION=-